MDAKKSPPAKGEQQSKKGSNQFKGKGNSKPKPVTMSQKIVDVNKQIAIKAKQADKTNSPTMKKPFEEVTKPTKTTKRIVQTPDGKGCQLLSEEEKKKVDRAKKLEALGLLHFSDDEDDELSLETITSNKSKGSNCWKMCTSTTMVSLKFLLQDPLQQVASINTTIISSKLNCFIKQAGLFNNHPTFTRNYPQRVYHTG